MSARKRLSAEWERYCVFIVGLLGVIYETVWSMTSRPDLLVLFAAMIGLPVYVVGARNNGRKDPPS